MTNPGRLLRATLVLCGLAAFAPAPAATQPTVAPRDGQHDFDFEFGTWHARVSRRLKPLTGSDIWVEYEGPSVVHPVWGGRANFGEIDVSGPGGRILGSSYRLYDPAARQWHIRWASASDGQLGPPMIGEFKDGRGEFYNQESYDGRAIFVRFIFSELKPESFKIEQAFSADGGKTWETNWIAKFKKTSDASWGR